MRKLSLLLCLLSVLPFAAHARARTDAIKSPVEIPIAAKATAAQVNLAAQLAAQSRGWVVENRKGNAFEAVYAQEGRRSFSARIGVTSSAKTVTIQYVSSEGLDYDEADGTISANYNKWMNFLERDIPTFVDWIVAAQ